MEDYDNVDSHNSNSNNNSAVEGTPRAPGDNLNITTNNNSPVVQNDGNSNYSGSPLSGGSGKSSRPKDKSGLSANSKKRSKHSHGTHKPRDKANGGIEMQHLDSPLMDGASGANRTSGEIKPNIESAMKTQTDILNFVSKEKSKKSFFRELIRHLFFTGIFIAVLFMQRDVFNSFLMNDALNTAFVSQQMDASVQPFPKTFLDVGEWSELADYLTTVVGATLDNYQSYSGANYTDPIETEFVEQNNRILGGLRLRQLRVAPTSGGCAIDLKSPNQLCYPLGYSDSTKETAPYGPDNMWTYSSGKDGEPCNGPSIFGNYVGDYVGSLSGDGYIIDIPLHPNLSFTDQIQFLIDNNWWDRQTRAIIITMNFLNIDLNGHVSVLYLIVEMPPGGIVYPSYMMKTFRVDMYTTSLDYFRAFLELVLVLLLAYNLYSEIKQIYDSIKRNNFRGYIKDGWNILELANLMMFGIVIGMYVHYLVHNRGFQYALPQDEYSCALEEIASGALDFYNLNAANILFTVFHTFKYLQLNRRLYVLWKTLRHAGLDLLGFFFIFFVFTIGFLFMGWITFGPDTNLFNSFGNAFATCWGFIMGNAPDYGTLANSNRLLGPAFFTLFSIFVFFILANMFIAILSSAFDDVRPNGTKKRLRLAQMLEKKLSEWLGKVRTLISPKEERPKRITYLLEHLEHPEILSQPNLTLDDMKRAIGKDATDADAHELQTWHQKLKSKSSIAKATEQSRAQPQKPPSSGSDSPSFSGSDEEDDEESDMVPVTSEEFQQMQNSISRLQDQMDRIQQSLQILLERQLGTPQNN